MSELVPTSNGDSDTQFELANGWMAQRVPLPECPVPMADVIERSEAAVDIFRRTYIHKIFEVMSESDVRLLRRHNVHQSLLDELHHLEFKIIEHRKISDTTGRTYPRNPNAQTAFIASEKMAQIMMEEFHDIITSIIESLPVAEKNSAWSVQYNFTQAYERYQSRVSGAVNELTAEISLLVSHLCKVASPELRTDYINMARRILTDESAYIIDQPNCRGQMTAFDNAALLHRTVDPEDVSLDFYSSNWHKDFFHGLGFLYSRKSDGVLMGGWSEDIY